MKLVFINDTDTPVNASLFTPLLKETLNRVPAATEDEVEFSLVDDATIQQVNKQTRGLDKPTDVLSFANREIKDSLATKEFAALPHGEPTSLGQIIISLPAAERNADEMGQSLKEELRFLFVHGLLHILGYDHKTPAEETKMMTLAYQILGRPPYQPD